MTRFLAVARRLFLGGVVSLLLSIFVLGIRGKTMLDGAMAHNSIAGFFSIFFLVAPIIYLILVLISTAYIRKHGQFAAVHQQQSPVTSFFRCLGSDLASPFKCIGNFFAALFNKNAMGRGIMIRRFIGMVILILVCLVGMGSLLQ